MSDKEKKNVVGWILFLCYFLLLSWLILLKFSTSLSEMGHYRNINLIPFQGSLIINDRVNLREIIYNIIAFVPMGVFLQMLKGKMPIWKITLVGFGVSLSYEVLQYIFAIGASDITDVIGNTFGCFVGVLVYLLLSRICGKKTDVIIQILAGIGMILVVGFLAVILWANR